jgi:hypothetical protein
MLPNFQELPVKGRSFYERNLSDKGKENMNQVIYIVGLIVVIVAVLKFFGVW